MALLWCVITIKLIEGFHGNEGNNQMEQIFRENSDLGLWVQFLYSHCVQWTGVVISSFTYFLCFSKGSVGTVLV